VLSVDPDAERGSRVPPAPRRKARITSRIGLHWWLQAPSVLVLGAVVIFPLVYSVNLSLRRYNPTLPDATGKWSGWPTSRGCCTTPIRSRFWLVTLIFVLVAVGLETVLGTLLGIFLNRLVAADGSSRRCCCCR